MMNDELFRSMSAFTAISDMMAKTDSMIAKSTGISLAIENSTRLTQGAENAMKYTSGIIPLLDSTAWLKNDVLSGYQNLASGAMVYNVSASFPILPTVPKWILDLNSPLHNTMKSVFAAQNSWQRILPTIPENSAVKNAMEIISGLTNFNTASKSISNMTKLSESILRFDASINNLYKFINDIDEDDEDLEIDVDSQLSAALGYDLENAITEDKRIAIAYVFQEMLDTLSNLSIDFTLGKEQKLFLTKLKSLVAEWNKNGKIFNSVMVLYLVFQPVIQHYHSEILGLEDDKPTVTINQTRIENNYITESPIQVVTTAIKHLKEEPDNRLKVQFTIPIGTKLNIVQDRGKWIKVKFTCEGIFYSGWVLNSDIK